MMNDDFPTAEEYAQERARHPALTVVDVRSVQAAIKAAYRNEVLVDVNTDCLRLAVFEGEYRWHYHPDSDELFLVVEGELQIDFEDARRLSLTAWQCTVVPAGTVHRTRGVGRTVNLTVEKRGARTVFLDRPPTEA